MLATMPQPPRTTVSEGLPFQLSWAAVCRLRLLGPLARIVRDTPEGRELIRAAVVERALRLLGEAAGPLEGAELAARIGIDRRSIDAALRSCMGVVKTHRRSERAYGVVPHRRFPVTTWYALTSSSPAADQP